MPNPFSRFFLLLLVTACLPWLPFPGAGGLGVASAGAQDEAPRIIEDDDVAPGVASGWIVGHQLLAEGRTADALPYLHLAYRAYPEVVVIAMDFQAALANEGYLKDALDVMDSLVAAWPDSQSFRLRRSALNLSAGRTGKALTDLREIRRQGNATVDVLAAEASILATDGKTAQALDVLRDGLHLFPDRSRDIYLEMGRILRQNNETEAIPALMDEALSDLPDEPLLWLVKIRSLASLGRHDEARSVAEEADRHFADLPAPEISDTLDDPMQLQDMAEPPGVTGLPADSFSVELADYYAQHNQIDQALAILQPLADRDELGLTPSLWLGRLLLGTGKATEGVALVERILNQWPESGRGWYLRGKVDEGRGDWEKAIPHFSRAVELDPYDPEIRLGIIRAMLIAWESDFRAVAPDSGQLKKLDELRMHTMVAGTLVPERDSEGQMMLGYAFSTIKDLDRAADRFNLAAQNPNLRLKALIQQSICQDENGQETAAKATLQLLRREFPDDPEVANSLGYFLAEKGQDLDLAEELVREALASDSGNGAYLDSLGWVMYRNGRLEEALDYLIQAVNVLPDDPIILEHLGVVLNTMGQHTEALDVLRRALGLGGDTERVGALIADIEGLPGKKE